MRSLVMAVALAFTLAVAYAFAAGCAQPPGQRGSEEPPERAGKPAENRMVKLPKAEPAPGGGSYWPPAVWLVHDGRAVQASYGQFCELDICGGGGPPKQAGKDLATARLPAGEGATVVVESVVADGFAAGVVGWEEHPRVDNYLFGALTESGLPYFMRALGARREPEGGKPVVKLAGEKPGSGAAVFELASTGRAGDRLLSVFLNIGGDPASYHWRLDPGRPGSNPPPTREKFSGTVTEVASTPETVTYPASEVTKDLNARAVKKAPLGDSPNRIEVGEGHLWVLDGPRLLKVDPATMKAVSALELPGDLPTMQVGAGAVWITDGEADSVTRVDPGTGKVTGKARLGGSPSEMVATESGVWVAVADGTQSGRVIRLDPETGEVIAGVETPGIAESVTVDEQTGDVWALALDQTKGYVDDENTQLIRISPRSNRISERLKVEGGVLDVVAGEGRVWIVSGDLKRLAPRSKKILTVVPLKPSDPYRMEFDGGSLWAVGSGDVVRVDLENGRALGSLKLGDYDTEDVTVGEGAVWVVGAGTGRGGTLTRITP